MEKKRETRGEGNQLSSTNKTKKQKPAICVLKHQHIKNNKTQFNKVNTGIPYLS